MQALAVRHASGATRNDQLGMIAVNIRALTDLSCASQIN